VKYARKQFVLGGWLMVAGLSLTCNPFAKKPSVPVVMGPTTGVAGVPLTFKATSEDPDGDTVAFMFDWGDTTTKVWTEFILSGETISVAHTYADSDNVAVKARAKNGKGAESGWSTGFPLALRGIGPGFPDSLAETVSMPIQGSVGSAAVTVDGSYLYVTLAENSRLLVMRTADCAFVDTVDVGGGPSELVRSTDGTRMYVTCPSCDSVYSVLLPGNTIDAQVCVGHRPTAMVLSPGGDYLYVASSRASYVSKVRTSDFVVVKELRTDSMPSALALDSLGRVLYVASFVESTLSAYSTEDGSVLGVAKVAKGLSALGVVPGMNKLYAGTTHGRIFVLPADLGGSARTVEVYGVVNSLVFLANGFYAAAPTDEYHGLPILRTDLDAVVGWLDPPGGLCCAVAVAPNGDRLYAIDSYRGRVCVYERRGAAGR